MRGWRRNATLFALGVAATLSLAPFFIFPFLLAFAGLFRLIDTAPDARRVFWDGWWWGWGYYISGLYWFTIALLTDPEKFGWLVPFALFGITAFIAIYPAIACWLTAKSNTMGITKIVVFASVWTFVEYIRSMLFSGFPWNLTGYSLAFSNDVLQLASVIGIYGLTWSAVALGTVPVLFFDPRASERKAILMNVLALALLIYASDWGGWRLRQIDSRPVEERYVPGVALRLVQANIAQHHKWDPKLQMEGLREHIRLTRQPGLQRVTHVVWPETAVPYVVRSDSPLSQLLGSAVESRQHLITGALRAEGEGEGEKIYNSIVVVNSSGDIVGNYDKAKLVPFGEFLPLRWLLPKAWLTPVGARDFDMGKGPVTLNWPGFIPTSPLICYEAIFPGRAADRADRPKLLLNITNDAWFGMSLGPYQHFEMSRMRAVEQGIPLVRVANTGITAVTDRYGRVTHKMTLGTQGILDIRLPTAQNGPTFYAKHGDLGLAFLLLLTVVLIIRQRRILID